MRGRMREGRKVIRPGRKKVGKKNRDQEKLLGEGKKRKGTSLDKQAFVCRLGSGGTFWPCHSCNGLIAFSLAGGEQDSW